jgi:hypothetical protein
VPKDLRLKLPEDLRRKLGLGHLGLKRLAQPGMAEKLRQSRVWTPGQELQPVEQEVLDYILKHRGDPKQRENVAACAAWLTQELGTSAWDRVYQTTQSAEPNKLPTIKQAIIQDIVRRLYPPDGKVPSEIRITNLTRQVAAEWEATCNSDTWRDACKQHGVSPKQKPDRHTVERAIGRKV